MEFFQHLKQNHVKSRCNLFLKLHRFLSENKKSARRDSNPRPRPWQGRAPPTEPLAHIVFSQTQAILYYKLSYLSTLFFIFSTIFSAKREFAHAPFPFCQVLRIALNTYWLFGKFLWVISSRRIKSTSSHNSSATTIRWENIIPKFISSYRPR